MLRESVRDVQKVNGKSCRGHCCERFTVSLSPEEVAAESALAVHGKSRFRDFATIGPMLVYLGKTNRDTNGKKHPDREPLHWYTCCWFDTVSRTCLIYSHRPEMCAAYPYGGTCRYNACACGPFWRRHRVTRWACGAAAWVRGKLRRKRKPDPKIYKAAG